MSYEKPDSFQCGAFSVAKNPDVTQFVDKLNRLREMVDSCRIQQGTGYTFTRSSGGTTLSIKTASEASSVAAHPFKLDVRTTTTAYEFKVGPGTVQNNAIQPNNINAWVGFTPVPARIYLEAVISDLEITSMTFKAQAAATALTRTAVTSGAQSFARITIGLYQATTSGGTDYRVVQNVKTDIMTPLFAFNGYPAIQLTQEVVNAYE
jgi:hypothetical protein